MMDTMALVAQVGLFQGVNQTHLTHLAKTMKVEHFEPGQVILAQGEVGQALYVPVSGSVEVRRERPGGEPVVLDTLGAGQFFGEMVLLDDAPRSASVVAQETS